jgi:hypothetical protein
MAAHESRPFASALAAAAPGGVGQLREEGLVRAAAALLAEHFDDKVRGDIEAAALRGTLGAGQLLSHEVVVLGVRDAGGAVQAAGLCVYRTIPQWGLQVLEIVWFAARQRGQGHGGRLFDYLLLAARSKGVDAILSSSTNKAMMFWLSRPGVRIAEVVIRAGRMEKPTLPAPFRLLDQPSGYVMERLYLNVMRNRKGKIVGSFEGRPYHYGAVTSNHVWYVVNSKLAIKTVTLQHAPPKPAARAEPDPARIELPATLPDHPLALDSPRLLERTAASCESEASSVGSPDSPSSGSSSWSLDSPSSASSFSSRGSRSASEVSASSESSESSELSKPSEPSKVVEPRKASNPSERVSEEYQAGPSASAASASASCSPVSSSSTSLPLPALHTPPAGSRVPPVA